MKTLNPTLWRTCRVLAGTARIRLLRLVLAHPDLGVSRLAEEAGIGQSDASQELRRLQSRGLLRRLRRGRRILFRPQPDPQVPSAAPLLKALKAVLTAESPARDPEICRIAMGFAHETRLRIARELARKPRRLAPLATALRLSPSTLAHHLHWLRAGGWVRAEGAWLLYTPPRHPVARTLAQLL